MPRRYNILRMLENFSPDFRDMKQIFNDLEDSDEDIYCISGNLIIFAPRKEDVERFGCLQPLKKMLKC